MLTVNQYVHDMVNLDRDLYPLSAFQLEIVNDELFVVHDSLTRQTNNFINFLLIQLKYTKPRPRLHNFSFVTSDDLRNQIQYYVHGIQHQNSSYSHLTFLIFLLFHWFIKYIGLDTYITTYSIIRVFDD